MTDTELIEALRHCHDGGSCAKCPVTPLSSDCGYTTLENAIDRFEAVLAENERLKAECDHFRDLTKKLWCEKQYGEDMNVPTAEETP